MRGRAIFAFKSLLTLICVHWIAGCASAAKDVGAAATPVVVHSTLQEANQPDEQNQVQHLLNSPAVQHVGQNIGEGVGIGLFNEANKLTDGGAATANSGTTLPTTAPGAKTPGAAALVGLTSGGGLNGFVKSSVQEAFLAATDPQFKAGEAAMSEAIGEGFVTGMITVLNDKGPALGETIRKQLGPIMQELIRDQIAPAVRDMLQKQLAPAALQVWREGAIETLKLTVRPDMQPDVQRNAENASIGASRGTQQVLIESGILTASGKLNEHMRFYLWVCAAIAALIVIALVSLLLLLNLLLFYHWRHRGDRYNSM